MLARAQCHSDSELEQLGEDPEDRTEGCRCHRSEPFAQSHAIDGSKLIEDNMPRFAPEPARHSIGIRTSTGGQGRDNGGAQMMV